MSGALQNKRRRVTTFQGDPQTSGFGGKKSRQDPPKAYTKGIQDFYGRNFIVTPDVLIPRPETEQIIDAVLILAGKPYLPGIKSTKNLLSDNPIILDVGTGSGCIAITIKKELPCSKVYATDISKEALSVAKKNARNLNAPIHLIISHLLKKVKEGALPIPDVIVANLPYVDKDWDWIDKKALSFEPDIALYADNRGLELIFNLIRDASDLKIEYLVLEADPIQHSPIEKFALKHGYKLKRKDGFILTFYFE